MHVEAKPRVVTKLMAPRPRHSSSSQTACDLVATRAGKPITISLQSPSALKLANRRVRRAGKGQVEAIKASMRRFGNVVPILVTSSGEVIDGHAQLEAARSLKHETVPTIVVDHLNPAEIKALRLSLNKLAEQGVWDMDAVALEFEELFAFDPSLLHFTGFVMPEIDVALAGLTLDDRSLDEEGGALSPKTVVSRLGDLWLFEGGHKLLCGNARESASYASLLDGETMQMVLTDPPYGCAIKGHVSRHHREFVEGSGMSEAETLTFFQAFLDAMTPRLADGAIVDIFIDSRGIFALLQAIRTAGLEQKTLAVWDKGAGGMGTLYRQQAEFVVITKWGKAPCINNVDLGRHGRIRTTIWAAPGMAQFGQGRKEALELHPTVKPVSLLIDALLDTSSIGGIVLDPFAGSGSLLLAAHRTRRVGRAIELDPVYVDVAVGRMEKLTGKPARHAETGLTFAEEAERRCDGVPAWASPAAACQVQA